jgi:hypothetical protein
VFKRRIEVPEFGDRPWLRGWLQEAYRDGLNLALKLGGQYQQMYAPFARWAADGKQSEVLELAAGGAGPTDTLLTSASRAEAVMPRIILSDLRPSVDDYDHLVARHGSRRLGYLAEPVSCLRAPVSAPRFRAIFSAFHHFSAKEARAMVADALEQDGGLFIMEPFHRDLRHLLMMLLSGPFVYMPAPFITARKCTLRKVLVSVLLPVIPLMLMIDGCLSILRVHTAEEISAMVPEEKRSHVVIESGQFRYMGLFRSFYVAIRSENVPAR